MCRSQWPGGSADRLRWERLPGALCWRQGKGKARLMLLLIQTGPTPRHKPTAAMGSWEGTTEDGMLLVTPYVEKSLARKCCSNSHFQWGSNNKQWKKESNLLPPSCREVSLEWQRLSAVNYWQKNREALRMLVYRPRSGPMHVQFPQLMGDTNLMTNQP